MVDKHSVLGQFAVEAQRILALQTAVEVNELGGYGPDSEVIYGAHPSGCPSVLVDSRDGATATFVSNGSVSFVAKLPDGMEVRVLDGHFDGVEKREISVPSNNIFLSLGKDRIVSLMNPRNNLNCPAQQLRIVKIGDPKRAMWYCGVFHPAPGLHLVAAIRLSLQTTRLGPALLREIYVENRGKKNVPADLWTYYNLHGTQRFVYNKELWYDAGYPATPTDIVMTARVPYSPTIQIKHLASECRNARPIASTCDYSTFIGDTADFALMPRAVREGHMLAGGAGPTINRFATAAVGASQFRLMLRPSGKAMLRQSLLFVTDPDACEAFKKASDYVQPSFKAMASAFARAAKGLVATTKGAVKSDIGATVSATPWPSFEVRLPAQKAVSEYANSAWTGVKELYENCRAHGARLADGIELGTRDRGQDMWPKMKEDPARIRADLVHAMSFMYVTQDEPFPKDQPLTLRQKLHGMFPRQFPSHWNNRDLEVRNDNRPYADSPLWLLDSLNMYVRETGDAGILLEKVKTVRLSDPDRPETSAIVGCNVILPVASVMDEVLACFQRLADDSPYGIAQILYGDWCDPVDMFGTSRVGDNKTRGHGRGVQIRLSAHLFLTLVDTIDLLESSKVAAKLAEANITPDVRRLQDFASRLRQNVVKVAWEDGPKGFMSAFLNCIHELKSDGRKPNWAGGEIGYTLGSMKGLDFDGVNRRELAAQAYAVEMLATKRPYLATIPHTEEMLAKVLNTVDKLCFNDKLGLVMFTPPIANNAKSIELVGRMGVLPSGTAENGEYHHCQIMMHRFRLSLADQADTVWQQFKPMMSAMRDASLCGPFETPSTSYISDKDDPHFGKGMYFGLSGSVDWIVEVFQKIAGLELSLHDDRLPALRVTPRLPAALDHQMTFRRVVHVATGPGQYRQIPLEIKIDRRGKGPKPLRCRVFVNGQEQEKAEIRDLAGIDKADIHITYEF